MYFRRTHTMDTGRRSWYFRYFANIKYWTISFENYTILYFQHYNLIFCTTFLSANRTWFYDLCYWYRLTPATNGLFLFLFHFVVVTIPATMLRTYQIVLADEANSATIVIVSEDLLERGGGVCFDKPRRWCHYGKNQIRSTLWWCHPRRIVASLDT